MYSTSPLHSGGVGPPLKWLPATADMAAVLWSSESLELVLEAVTATPDAFAFELRALVWHPQGRGSGFLSGEGEGRFRVGLELSDGTRLTARMLGEHWPDDERSGAVLVEEGGSGGAGSSVHRFVAGIIPPDGGFDVVFQWPDEEVPLTRYHIESEPISEAAGRAKEAW